MLVQDRNTYDLHNRRDNDYLNEVAAGISENE